MEGARLDGEAEWWENGLGDVRAAAAADTPETSFKEET